MGAAVSSPAVAGEARAGDSNTETSDTSDESYSLKYHVRSWGNTCLYMHTQPLYMYIYIHVHVCVYTCTVHTYILCTVYMYMCICSVVRGLYTCTCECVHAVLVHVQCSALLCTYILIDSMQILHDCHIVQRLLEGDEDNQRRW